MGSDDKKTLVKNNVYVIATVKGNIGNVTDLGGHSGCMILLCERANNEIFVRKISSDTNYNKRLRIQAEKQSAYSNPKIHTPKVFGTGYTDDGLYYFDMEYIQGITM